MWHNERIIQSKKLDNEIHERDKMANPKKNYYFRRMNFKRAININFLHANILTLLSYQ